MLLSCREAHPLPFCMGPGAKCLDIALSQSRFRMKREIKPQGHIARCDLTADVMEQFPGSLRVRLWPDGEIHMSPTVIDIAGDEPGHRSDVAIPRPTCQIGMAIIARALEDRVSSRRNLGACFNGLARVNRRVRSSRSNDLRRREQGNNSYDDFFAATFQKIRHGFVHAPFTWRAKWSHRAFSYPNSGFACRAFFPAALSHAFGSVSCDQARAEDMAIDLNERAARSNQSENG